LILGEPVDIVIGLFVLTPESEEILMRIGGIRRVEEIGGGAFSSLDFVDDNVVPSHGCTENAGVSGDT
jgi:hypothetical protein